MNFPQISMIVSAFGAGLLSFLSPCVLPLVPAYISFMSGVSIEDLQHADRKSDVLKKTITTSLAFIIGFSLIFVLLGVAAAAIARFSFLRSDLVNKIAGSIIIIFGLHFLGLFETYLRFLNYEKRFHLKKIRVGMIGAFVVGLAFAFGWTPCFSPFLGSILVLAGKQGTIWQGVFLLSVYSLGLGVPFLLTAIATHSCLNIFSSIKRHFRIISIISGVFLVIVGVLIFIGRFSILTAKLTEWFPWLLQLSE